MKSKSNIAKEKKQKFAPKKDNRTKAGTKREAQKVDVLVDDPAATEGPVSHLHHARCPTCKERITHLVASGAFDVEAVWAGDFSDLDGDDDDEDDGRNDDAIDPCAAYGASDAHCHGSIKGQLRAGIQADGTVDWDPPTYSVDSSLLPDDDQQCPICGGLHGVDWSDHEVSIREETVSYFLHCGGCGKSAVAEGGIPEEVARDAHGQLLNGIDAALDGNGW